jgi:phosphoribosylamine---glycine ligase
VIAAEGYPEKPVKGGKIENIGTERSGVSRPGAGRERGGSERPWPSDAYLLHAGTARTADGALVAAGGRVLNAVGSGPDVAAARARAYELASTVSLRGGWYRRDIAARL